MKVYSRIYLAQVNREVLVRGVVEKIMGNQLSIVVVWAENDMGRYFDGANWHVHIDRCFDSAEEACDAQD